MPSSPPPFRRAGLAVFLCCAIVLCAQDPILKPTTAPTVTARLAAPTQVTGRQLPDGRIEVRWNAVEGAVRYQVTRSVPPDGAHVIQPDPTGPGYVDSDIKQGRTYYYVVAAYSSDGALGLKAGSNPVYAMLPLGGGTSAQTILQGFHAELVAPNRVHLSWSMPVPLTVAVYVTIQRVATTSTGTTSTLIGRVLPGVQAFDDNFNLPGATQLTYQIAVEGQTAPPVMSNPVILGSTPPLSTDSVATPQTGSATFKVMPALTLKVGATSSLAAAGGAGGRWISTDESVATVDAAGTVVARATGTTYVVSLANEAGSLRVTSAAVNVTP